AKLRGICFVRASRRSRLRPLRPTMAPTAASPSAIASPMPDDAPVTTNTWSFKENRSNPRACALMPPSFPNPLDHRMAGARRESGSEVRYAVENSRRPAEPGWLSRLGSPQDRGGEKRQHALDRQHASGLAEIEFGAGQHIVPASAEMRRRGKSGVTPRCTVVAGGVPAEEADEEAAGKDGDASVVPLARECDEMIRPRSLGRA